MRHALAILATIAVMIPAPPGRRARISTSAAEAPGKKGFLA